ncbi:MAG: TonB-dependent receptor [Candidatus Abyssobacteria bacterium SURF_5]|uniref:TonB-dependent receptor n=1 Tax=Abyssobacteria bacterium (strain SURF_5) TaxID=2093360 RepID=A0A3A4P009_ABYX5|nr:MAG: TonB-dependent receptor [Candidatus Abyssubacteria bacterium SURF_5]
MLLPVNSVFLKNQVAYEEDAPVKPRLKLTLIAFSIVLIFLLPVRNSDAENELENEQTAAPLPEESEQVFPKRELLFFEEIPIVISATRQEQPITQSPSSISIITAEDIRRSSATTVVDLLRSVPGLDVMRITPSDASVSARGFNEPSNNDMLLLIDGRSAYVDFFGIVVWDDLPIVLEEIDRIEIIRGPGSALYGANAFSGVINIITKSPEQLKGTSVSATAGEFHTRILSVTNANVFDNWSYKLVAGWDEANSFEDSGDNDRRTFRGNVLVNYNFDPTQRIYFSAGGTEGTGNTLTRVAQFERDGLNGFAKLNYDYENWKLQTFYNLIDIDVEADDENERSIMNNVLDFELQHSLSPWEKHMITWGSNYRFNSIISHEIIGDDEEESLFSLFVQDQYAIQDDMTLTAGLRFDSHPLTGVHFSPRASIVYEPWRDHIFRASVARAFRNPSFVESYLNLTFVEPPVTVFSRGDTDLDAEEMTSFEMGYQTRLFDSRLEFKVDTFYNILDEIIEFRKASSPDPTTIHLEFFNAGKAIAYGGEIGLVYRPAAWFSTYCNYSFQELEARSDGVQFQLNEEGERIESSPRHKFNAGLFASSESGWNGAVELNLVSEATFGYLDSAAGFEPVETELDDYSRVDVRIGYRFTKYDVETSLIIQNALNDVHREFPIGERLQRIVLLEVFGRF